MYSNNVKQTEVLLKENWVYLRYNNSLLPYSAQISIKTCYSKLNGSSMRSSLNSPANLYYTFMLGKTTILLNKKYYYDVIF